MIEIFEVSEPSPGSYAGCLLGDEDRRNVVFKRELAVALLLTVTVSCVLLYHNKLRRLYLPLGRITNASLILRMVGCMLYFTFYPYAEDEGNCAELVINRAYYGVIMLGELHQVYFLANALGLSRMRPLGFTWTRLLNLCTVLIFGMLIASLFFRKLLTIHNLWSFFVSSMQIRVIREARQNANLDEQLISGNDTSVRIFEKLSLCQLIPSGFSFLKRAVSFLFHICLDHWFRYLT